MSGKTMTIIGSLVAITEIFIISFMLHAKPVCPADLLCMQMDQCVERDEPKK